MRKGEIPCGISPFLTELAKIGLRLPDHNFILTVGSEAASANPPIRTSCETVARAFRRLKTFQFPGGSMNIVTDARQAAGLLSS